MVRYKKLLIFTSLFIILSGCSSTKKVINGKEQSFSEYVLLNRNSEWKGGNWMDMPSDNFPGIRLKKWLEAD